MSRNDDSLLQVQDLSVEFETDEGTILAVENVGFSISPGRTLALVGESGCGKSVTALSILRLIPHPPGRITAGNIFFREQGKGNKDQGTEIDRTPVDLLRLSESALRRIRGRRIAMIFQDPLSALNPVYTIGEQIVEALESHRGVHGKGARDMAVDLLRKVGIPAPEQRMNEYPHRFSGGMCQRVMIAMALAGDPALLIADEPTTALDVTIQAQILDLLAGLQETTGMALLLITHDFGVVAQMADEVAVMYAGRIVERAEVKELFDNPLHPYTRALLECMPSGSRAEGRLPTIPGAVPTPHHYPLGCRFHPRCRLTRDRAAGGQRPIITIADGGGPAQILHRCVDNTPDESGGVPDLREIRPNHFVACWEAAPA